MKQEILSSSSHSEPGEQIFECKAEVPSLPSGKPSAESERNYGRFHVNNIPDFTTSRHSANQNMHPDCANRNSSMRNPTSANPNLNCSQKSPTHVNIGHTQILNSDDPQRLLPTPFLSKTYQLVDDTASDEVVSWNKNGTTFVVWCPAEFAKDILPNYFKHNNFSSFVRQLNTYGFRKVVPDRWEFAHDCFRKGEKHLLIEIHRRKPGVLPSKPSTSLHKQFTTPPTTSTSEQATSSGSSPLSSQLEKSAHIHIDEADKLKKENMLLVSELSCLRRLCSDLLLYIQRHVKNPTGFTSPVESLLQSKSILQDTSLYKSFWASDKRTGTDMDSVDEAKEEGSGCEFYRSKNVDDGENCEFDRSKNVDNGEDDLDLRLVLAQASWCKESYGCNGNGATKCIGDGGRRSPPRLIGVSLPCQKRVRHDKIWSLQL